MTGAIAWASSMAGGVGRFSGAPRRLTVAQENADGRETDAGGGELVVNSVSSEQCV